MGAEQRVVELVIDASGTVAGARLVSQAYDHMGDRAEAAAQKAQAAFDRQQQIYSRQLPRSIDQVGDAYDRLRGRIDPVFNSQLRAEREMTQSLAVINRAVLLGVTTEREAAATIAKLKRQQIEEINRVRDAQIQANSAVRMHSVANDNDPETGVQHRRQNLGFQLQDIGVSLYGGMPIATVLIQQGSQILGIYGGQGGVNAAIRDFTAIVSAAVRYVAPFAAAGAIAYGAYKILAANTAEASLAVDDLTRNLASQATTVGGVQSQINGLSSLQKEYRDAIAETGTTHSTVTTSIISGLERQFGAQKALLELELRRQDALVKTQQSELAIAEIQLRRQVATSVNTRMDLEARGFADPRIGRFVNNLPDDITGLAATREILENSPLADKIKEMRANLTLTEEAANSLRRALEKTFTDVGGPDRPGGIGPLVSDSSIYPDLGQLGGLFSENGKLYSPEDFIPKGNIPGPQSRPLRELDPGLNPYDQINKSGKERLQQLQQEADALGLTGSAAAALRFEQEQLNSAYSQNLELSPDQIKAIHEQASAYGQLTAQMARARMQADLQFDIDQLGRSAIDQRIASAQKSAGLPIDLNGDYAGQVRQMERVKELRSDVTGFFSDFKEGLLSGDSIGEALRNSIINALSKQADRLWDQVFNSLARIAFPGGAGAQNTGLSAAGSIAGSLFSGKAANDNRAGGFSGLASASSIPATDVASYIAKAAAQRGIDPGIALRVAKSEGGLNSWNMQSSVFKNGVQEPSFGPYQLYMGGGLGNEFQRRTGLDPRLSANGPAGVDFALDHAAKNGWGSWYGAAKVGVGKWDGIGQGAGLGDAAQAASKFATATDAATKGLDTFGGGLGKVGQSLISAPFPAAPAAPSGGGGGLFGWLGGLFGGGGLNSALSASPQFAKAWSLGGIGLYDRGGFTGHGGVNDPAGVVHRGEVVWSQADVARAGGVGVVEGMRLGLQGYADGGVGGGRPTVAPIRQAAGPAPANTNLRFEHVHSFDGDGNIKTMTRTIVREEAPDISRQVTSDQLRRERKEQERSGFGTVQAIYTKRKG